ncbi:MAG: hypothetical protein AABZ74_12325 [Cyanobacteriota bacterium]
MRSFLEWSFVLVVCFILIAMSLPNFISCGPRSPLADVKSNMHTFQTILETYSVDASGKYPKNVEELYKFANTGNNKYWKNFKNPYANKSGKSVSYDNYSNLNKKIITHFFSKDSYVLQGRPGVVYYAPVIGSNNYCIYGSNKDGELITDTQSGIAFALSNN